MSKNDGVELNWEKVTQSHPFTDTNRMNDYMALSPLLLVAPLSSPSQFL